MCCTLAWRQRWHEWRGSRRVGARGSWSVLPTCGGQPVPLTSSSRREPRARRGCWEDRIRPPARPPSATTVDCCHGNECQAATSAWQEGRERQRRNVPGGLFLLQVRSFKSMFLSCGSLAFSFNYSGKFSVVVNCFLGL